MMKSILVAAFTSLICSITMQAQGIEFFHGTWSEGLAKAKAEDKLIFVDAFASWCGPCKRMASQTFTHQKAGEFYNSNFVCMKFDMEKAENAEFAGKYPVGSYPTLMFIDADGKIVYKGVGFQEVDPLIEMGKKAMGKASKAQDYEKGYAEGNRDPKFLYEYVRALNRNGQPSLKITNEYLNTQSDLSTEFNLRFILEGAVEADSRVFDLLVKNKAKIIALVGEEPVKTRSELACRNTVSKATEFKNDALLKEAKDKMKAAFPERGAAFASEVDMRYYATTKDVKNFLKSAQAYRKNEVKNNSAQLHELTISLIRAFPDDKKVMDQAEKWAKDAAENGGLAEYYMTLAGIYKLKGEKDKARATAKKAIEVIGEKDNGLKAKIDNFINTLG